MVTTVANVSSSALLDRIDTALTNGGFSTNVNASGTSGYVVVDIDAGGGGIDSLHVSLPSDDELTLRVGLNWDTGKGDFVHPDDGIYDECEDPTFPGEIWSDTTTLGSSTGDITYGTEWVAWHGRDGTQVRLGATPLARGGNDYQSFPETLTCQCNAAGDPVARCDGEDDTFSYDTTGYRGLTYAAVLIRGGWNAESHSTITGDTGSTSGSRDADIRTTPASARLGNGEYGRDTEWELEDHNDNLAGTHDRWITSDDNPINLSTRGSFDANGTYVAPRPTWDGAVYED